METSFKKILRENYYCQRESIQLQDIDFQYVSDMAFFLPRDQAHLDELLENSHHYTLRYKNEIVVVFGLTELWDKVAEGWVFPTKKMLTHKQAAVRVINFWLENTVEALGIVRLHTTVDPGRQNAIRFAQSLKFQTEAFLRCFGPGGRDVLMMARFFEEK